MAQIWCLEFQCTYINILRFTHTHTQTCYCPHGNWSNNRVFETISLTLTPLLHTLWFTLSSSLSVWRHNTIFSSWWEPQVIATGWKTTPLTKHSKPLPVVGLPRRGVSFHTFSFFSCTCSWKEGAKRQKYKVEGSTHLTSVEPTLGTKPRAYQRLMPPLLLWKTLLLPVCSLLPNSSTPHGFLLFLSATPLAETTTRDLLQVTSLLPLPLSSICHDHMVNLNEEM